jgi:REP element-mobilizing transposase RayT
VYHITSRGNERKKIFWDSQDREVFLETLGHVITRYNWLCHAYCMMDNHYHLLIETPDGNLSIGMRQLNGVYTQLFNKGHGRVGHLFQGRFEAIVVQKDSHLLEACRYVVLNPVRAKMVEAPGQWIWSSYLATAGQRRPHPSLTTEWVLAQFASDGKGAQEAYCRFVDDGFAEDSIWKDLRGQSILGTSDFVQDMGGHVKGKESIPEIPKSQRFINRPTLESLFVDGRVRDRRERDERIFEAVESHGYTQREVADHLGLHFTSVSRIMKTKGVMSRK